MTYEVQPLPFKPHRLEGLSDRLLLSHCKNNYGGAVRRLNAIEGRLAGLDWVATSVFDLNGLGCERLIAANSMILHEAYFDALGGSGEPSDSLARALEPAVYSEEAEDEVRAQLLKLNGVLVWSIHRRTAGTGTGSTPCCERLPRRAYASAPILTSS
jgi:hypothetical protein